MEKSKPPARQSKNSQNRVDLDAELRLHRGRH